MHAPNQQSSSTTEALYSPLSTAVAAQSTTAASGASAITLAASDTQLDAVAITPTVPTNSSLGLPKCSSTSSFATSSVSVDSRLVLISNPLYQAPADSALTVPGPTDRCKPSQLSTIVSSLLLLFTLFLLFLLLLWWFFRSVVQLCSSHFFVRANAVRLVCVDWCESLRFCFCCCCCDNSVAVAIEDFKPHGGLVETRPCLVSLLIEQSVCGLAAGMYATRVFTVSSFMSHSEHDLMLNIFVRRVWSVLFHDTTHRAQVSLCGTSFQRSNFFMGTKSNGTIGSCRSFGVVLCAHFIGRFGGPPSAFGN
jgi:hypothetical protein